MTPESRGLKGGIVVASERHGDGGLRKLEVRLWLCVDGSWHQGREGERGGGGMRWGEGKRMPCAH